MLRNLALGAALTAGVAHGCSLTMTTYAEGNCIVQLNQKVVTDSDEGQCNYADAVKSYLEWECASGKAAIDVGYYSDSGCSSQESSFTVADGVCTKDSKTGFFFKVTGDCCGFTAPMPGSGNADEKHYRHVQMKQQMDKMMQGRKDSSDEAPMPGSDNADEIHYMNVRLKEATMKKLDRLTNAAQRSSSIGSSSGSSSSESSSRDDIVLGGDSADEKHYRNAQMKRMVQGAMEEISEKTSHTMHRGERMMHNGPAGVTHRFAARMMGKRQEHRQHRRPHGDFKPLPRLPHGDFKPLPRLPNMGQSSEMISDDTEETGTF